MIIQQRDFTVTLPIENRVKSRGHLNCELCWQALYAHDVRVFQFYGLWDRVEKWPMPLYNAA